MGEHPGAGTKDGNADTKQTPEQAAAAAAIAASVAAGEKQAGKTKVHDEDEFIVRSSVKSNKMDRKIAKLVETHARVLGEKKGVTVESIGSHQVVYHGDTIGVRKVELE